MEKTCPSTVDVKLIGDRILVKSLPNRPGTYVEPAVISRNG
ncbi:MAG: hypothetical protein QNJ65_09960 [Xenococcaceae cyanobacterium MO_234.B1]|nr:hypothetical protein [Xenococcaceae cyanobacterium MO_234.B1]